MGRVTSVIQVVGYSNSGKTTFVEKVVASFTQSNINVATIKHHGHKGPLTALDEKKDSWRHRQAGSAATIVTGQNQLQLQITNDQSWRLADLIQLYEPFQFDCIVVEGYKFEDYPKVVIIKEAGDRALLHELTNIIAVITWDERLIDLSKGIRVPVFSIGDETAITWLRDNYVRGDMHE
ncbi:molybdopterin-guanine dinucleotide biosynthesis protein B [Desertibacillus haloalkaliphilus]|uniref:molybdopterin-guanine dinucleotide biosynthesis protein B n=1 Tax=Desertibacillus haloalkaliphilus TaxID=1328930 RepID=UPI001C2772D9|nr:molybdopterin-guanine dinucleotide biosynthesis protein B [Desertibacillus haloalkaliphilus]MBU8905032.1 molybdopterin-guanine dinucleotide biosynthesis protein B [Desertibacillus haloalkaliphilus]